MQLPRSRADSALVDDGLEYLQSGKIHTSPLENESITIIQLPGWISQHNLEPLRNEPSQEVMHAFENRADAAFEDGPSGHSGAARGRWGHAGAGRRGRRGRRVGIYRRCLSDSTTDPRSRADRAPAHRQALR